MPEASRRRAIGGRLLAATVVASAVLAALAGLGLALASGLLLDPAPGDFAVYLAAARRIAAGGPLYVYGRSTGGIPLDVQDPYLYPPVLAVALLPVAGFSAGPVSTAAAWLLAAANSAVALALGRTIPDRRHRLLFALLWAGFLPQWSLWRLGNADALVIALIGAAVLAARRDHAGWAGALLGLATVLKLYPGILLLAAVGGRRGRLVLSAGISGLIAALATLPVVGLGTWWTYVQDVLPVLGDPVTAPRAQSLVAALGRLLPTVGLDGLRLVGLAVAAAAALLAVAVGARRVPPASALTALAPLALLAPAATWFIRYPLLLLPMATLLASGRRAGLVVAAAGYTLAQLSAVFVAWPTVPAWLAAAPTLGAATILLGALSIVRTAASPADHASCR